MSTSDYIHGFDPIEQKRLLAQAQVLQSLIYPNFDFSGIKSLLELGCGVGAQTRILLKQNRKMKITSIDNSLTQLAQASNNLSRENRVELLHLETFPWPLKNKTFDAVFVCWVLEHAHEINVLLKEAFRVIRPGGRIFVNEVYHHSLSISPELPLFQKFWKAMSTTQIQMGGDPQVGGKLAILLKNAGFKKIRMHAQPFHYYSGSQDTKKYHSYLYDLFMSAKDGIVRKGHMSASEVDAALKEFQGLTLKKEFNFFYTIIQAEAFR